MKGLQDKCTSLILNSTNLESELNKLKTNTNELTSRLDEVNVQKEQAEKDYFSNLNKLRELIFGKSIILLKFIQKKFLI